VSEALRRRAGEAWAFRARVEHEAALRFARLAEAIAGFDAESPIPALLRRAADDERRHEDLCADLAQQYGHAASREGEDGAIAPAGLDRRSAALYEMVAACCITETESMATLASLLEGPADPTVEKVLREIARDEVAHGRMGWAHLAREAARSDVGFLSRWIPSMLSGTVGDDLFSAVDEELEASGLLRLGVLPHSMKRRIFVGTLDGVVLPGLEKFGVDPEPARAWLAARRAG